MTLRQRLALLLATVFVGAGPAVEQVGRVRMAIAVPDGAPIASVLLIPGATTLLKIDPAGDMDNSSNFVIRIRDLLLRAGFAIAYVEDPSDLRGAIARLAGLRGRSSCFRRAAERSSRCATRVLGDAGPHGIILTSLVSRTSKSESGSVNDVNVSRLAVPALLIANRNDTCSVTPAAGMAALAARFPKGADVTTSTFESSQMIGTDACEPASPHGYLGIENEVTGRIVAWMRAHLPSAAPPP